MLNVESIIGIPDYGSLFQDFNKANADGLMAVQELRISAGSKEGSVEVHYRDDCTVDGWLPRPVLPTVALSHTWKDMFKCSDPRQGFPVSFSYHPTTGERGNRQSWIYDVRFAGGMVEEFTLPCPSIPVTMTRDVLVEGLREMPRQVFTEKGLKQLATGKDNVFKLLKMKGYWSTYGFIWEQFFLDLPQSDDDIRYPKIAEKVALRHLFNKFGGVNIQVRCH